MGFALERVLDQFRGEDVTLRVATRSGPCGFVSYRRDAVQLTRL